MIYTVCIETPKTFYEITQLTEDDVKMMASAFQERSDRFFFSGIQYDIKEAKLFRVFSCESIEKYYQQINEREDVKGEIYIFGDKGYFKADSLEKIFPDVTNQFIKKFFIGKSENSFKSHPYVNKSKIDELRLINNKTFSPKRIFICVKKLTLAMKTNATSLLSFL